MNILISNDDGYLAPRFGSFGKSVCRICQMSGWLRPNAIAVGVSNSLTLDRPLQLKQAENGFYYVNGTPTDCIHVGQHALADFKPDLVLSGINNGANMGDDTLYSGTVAAATEAYLMGIPAIAFSLADSSGRYWEPRKSRLDTAFLLSQNALFPNPSYGTSISQPVAPEDIQGIKLHDSGRRHHEQSIVPMYNPRGEQIYWIGPVGDVSDSEERYRLWRMRIRLHHDYPPCKSI